MIVKINGVPVKFVNESIMIEDTVGERSTASFVVWDETGSRHYQKGEPYQIYDNDGDLIISGVIEDSREQACGPVEPGILHEITGTDNHYFADKRIVAKSYTNLTAGAIVHELIQSYLSKEGISCGEIQDGPVVTESVFNYIPVTDCLDSLAEKAGFWWNIDSQKQLYFVARQTYVAPWEVNSIDVLDEPEVTQGNPQYRNKQYVIGGKDVTDTLTEIMVGDGQTRSFTVGFSIAQEPAIVIQRGLEVVGIPSSGIGIKGKDQGKQWYWSKGDPVVVQDDNESVLGASDQVRITYRGEFPMVAIYAYAPEVNRLRTLEGDGTGLVENVENEETNSKKAALQSATSKIQQYAVDGRKLEFRTDRKGLKPGQLITVNLPKYGLNRIEMLIQTVQIQDDVTRLIYDITAIEGPADESWAKFFYNLVTTKQQVIRENISEDEILVILEQYSKTWLPGDGNNIFRTCYPAGDLCPGSDLYPQFGMGDRIKYVVLLDSMNKEIGRYGPIQQTGCDTNNISSTFYILPNQATGSIVKLAWYGGTSASLYPGSGVKVAEVDYVHNKTSMESIQIERTDLKGW